MIGFLLLPGFIIFLKIYPGNMILPDGLPWSLIFMVVLAMVVLILAASALSRYINDRRMRRNGLEPFISCNSRKRWGTPDLVGRWQSQAILHLARELSKLQHTIWLVRHRIENLREMESGVREKRKELDRSLSIAKKRRVSDSVQFILFEIRESESKIADILLRIDQNEHNLQVMQRIMIEKKECINAYKAGKNPKTRFVGKVRGIISFLK
jgi:hypothetical protein